MDQSLPILDENQNFLQANAPFQSKLNKAPSHPVEQLEIAYPRVQGAFKEYTVNNVYGSGMFMQLRMEQEILSQPLRLPGLSNSYAGLETLLGKDEDFGFEDFMNLPENSERMIDTHEVMEHRLNMGIEKLH